MVPASWTGQPAIQAMHVAEALQYRAREVM
jgi:hypothetical protein